MGNFIRRAAPAAALTGTAVALVALFDPGVHAVTGGSTSADALPAKLSAGSNDGSTTATTPKPSATKKSTPSQAPSTDTPTADPTPTADSTKSGGSTDCSTAKEYTGPVVNTRWGPVQVVATITGGKVCTADAVQYPDGDGRSQEISSYSVPQLNEQAVSQNGDISGVSGASYTSYGYYKSLQAILQKAR